MKRLAKDLPHSQVYDSRYATVQRRLSTVNKSLENIHEHLQDVEEAEARALQQKHEQTEFYEYNKGWMSKTINFIWRNTFAQLGEDWMFLALLGILVAIISYVSDKIIGICWNSKMYLYRDLADKHFAKYIGWISLPICLILFDVGFTKLVAPQSAGSGLPQIKTILRGAVVKEWLTFKVLIAKWVGVTSTLSSGMPLGKEGPLIHMSSVIMTKMSKLIGSFRNIYLNESRTIEMLGAASAVGVACTFNAPIGGVLFSVEITTAYYAVRNYWRGFFAAVWGATTYRLLSVWIDGVDTITVVFKTNFFVDFPYDPQELFAFAITGLICGLGGSFYIWCKMNFNRWMKSNALIKKLKELNLFIVPSFIVLLISTITFPLGIGQFIAEEIPPRQQVVELFSNFTWTNNLTIAQEQVVSHWTTKFTTIYTNLVCYVIFQFTCSIIASTMPIPCGSFIPSFRCGAAIGRIAGELMHQWFPLGVRYKGKITQIMPGAYATVGAAAFGGAVTHTMSVCVILFEMTSQITHVIPVLIAVLIANGVAGLLTPSVYDLAIQSGKLPYLPNLLPKNSAIYNVLVRDFMVKDVKCIFLGMFYRELRDVLRDNRKIRNFPLVDHPQNMILLGSIPRHSLLRLLEVKLLQNSDILGKYKVTKSHKKSKVKRSVSSETHRDGQEEFLEQEVDFTGTHIDPAPFQLVEKTSLLKVHSLFSMLALNLAYVTSIGRLVGIVGLKELRQAIEDTNKGDLGAKTAETTPLIKDKP